MNLRLTALAATVFVVACVDTTDAYLDDYSLCAISIDCDSQRCEAIERNGVRDRFCARACSSTDECDPTPMGQPGTCADIVLTEGDSAESLCVETCTSDADCAVGWACQDDAGARYCQPVPLATGE